MDLTDKVRDQLEKDVTVTKVVSHEPEIGVDNETRVPQDSIERDIMPTISQDGAETEPVVKTEVTELDNFVSPENQMSQKETIPQPHDTINNSDGLNGHSNGKQDDDISIDSLNDNSEKHSTQHDETDNTDDDDFGLSNQMCPESETKFRVENNLIHRLEEGKFMIKEYRRSAADTNDLDSPNNLRTKSALAKTVSYLLTSVMRSQEFSFFDKYNFIFDRLRAVRQELTIQRLSRSWFGLKILIGCCNFYLVSRRIFVDTKEGENFIDLPKFNEQHLHECIGTVIDFMKEIPVDELFGSELSTTREAIAILLLSSLDQMKASNIILNFIFSIINHLKSHNILVNPVILFKSYHMNNWTRFSRVFHRLSRIQQITVEPYVKNIRKKCLQGCAIAYHNQKLPMNLLCSWLLIIQEELIQIIDESPGLEIKIGEMGEYQVQFNKKEFILENIPEDLFATPASGALSQHALYDMCQVSEYDDIGDLAPQIERVELEDDYVELNKKDVVSINPLDVAKSSSDDEGVPIWMQKATKTDRPRNRKNRDRNRGKNMDEDDRRVRHQSDRSNRTRKTSHRSRERPRETNRDENRRPDDRYADNRKRNRNRNRNRDRSGENRARGKKPGSTAARSWQHDDRTRTSY